MENYVRMSLETHLFFARIMKEHALFLEAGFPGKEDAWIQKADRLKQQFEELLERAIDMSNGIVSDKVLQSGELVTQFTIPAEKRTGALTGIPIDCSLSERAKNLSADCRYDRNPAMVRWVERLNERSLVLLDELISFKESILREVRNGCLFNTNYPLLIEHIMREAKLYRSTIRQLKQNRILSGSSLRAMEDFWNQIMMEHALFIRGLLDPSEEQLIMAADGFAADYRELLERARRQDCRAAAGLTGKSLEETLKYREFKTAGAEGILNCEIASIILPLLADHVLREANHYIRILESTPAERRQ